MKFGIAIVFCLSINLISARTEVNIWGDVNATEFGRIRAVKTDDTLKSFTFTYPEVKLNYHFCTIWYNFMVQTNISFIVSIKQTPNEYPIVGIKLIDDDPPTIIEFVEGNIGDKQVTIRISIEGHKIDSLFIFYHNPKWRSIFRKWMFIRWVVKYIDKKWFYIKIQQYRTNEASLTHQPNIFPWFILKGIFTLSIVKKCFEFLYCIAKSSITSREIA